MAELTWTCRVKGCGTTLRASSNKELADKISTHNDKNIAGHQGVKK
jgi:hypothetical protein